MKLFLNHSLKIISIVSIVLFLLGCNDDDTETPTPTVDTVAPIITLVGDATINLITGDTFTDPGATAMDDTDGDISGNIVIGGDTVDTNTEGTYTITYNVMDAAGNAATEVLRMVVVAAAATAPTVSAPIPTHPAEKVDGNFALHYPNFNYQGTQFAGNEDMSSMEFVHIDMWTLDATDVQFTPISAATGEFLVGLNPITSGEWVSYDIPLTEFTGMMFNDIFQFKFDGQGGTDPSNIWLDNIYFYRTSDIPTAPTTSAPIPTHPASDVISVYSDSYTNIAVSEFDPNWGQSGHTMVNTEYDPGDGNFALHYPNFNYQGTQFAGTEDMSSMDFVHIDMWTLDATDVQFTPISAATGEFLVGLNPITSGEWVSYDIPLSNFTGMMFNDLIQLKFDGQGGTDPSNIWLDNIYFYSSGGGGGGCTGTPVSATSFPVDFEGCESFLSTFTDVGSITTELTANPSQSGINTSANSLKVVKAAGTNRWAGFQNVFGSSLDLTKTFKLKVYSSKPNAVFRFEVNNEPQDNASGNPGPQFRTIAEANTWTEVEVFFTGVPANNTGVNQFVIKPDNPDGTDGELTTSEEVYYVDDIRLE